MKEFRKFLCIFLLQNLFFALYAGEISENFSQYRLSNGMNVFVYEDFSSPTVLIQYNCKAGISCQTPSNAGFFPLYTHLFKNAGKYSDRTNPVWLLDSLNSECNADSAVYTVEASSSQVRDIFEQLSLSAFAPVFSDAELGAALDDAKKTVSQNAFSIEGFINSSIDSRVFSASPWKHDSGIYPSLFKGRNLASSRFILSEISRKYYSPQNSSLFVTGAVSKEAVLLFAEETFGKFPPHSLASVSSEPPETAGETVEKEEGRRFVLSDPELSPDMAQTVVQFTGLSMEEADIASLILNRRYSALKQSLTGEPSLNIRGSDYINAEAAHKNNSSRLIIQALLEKSKMNYFSQCALFEKTLKENLTIFSEEEFDGAKNALIYDFKKSIETPRSFMTLFSRFWAIDKNADTEAFICRIEKIQNVTYDGLKNSLDAEEPFFFFLLNSGTFKPLEKKFASSGFKSVTVQNGSWYTRRLYQEIRDSAERGTTAENEPSSSYPLYDKKFVRQNEENTHSAFLKNGIPVTAKINRQSPSALLALYIKGGEALTAKKMYAMESLAADTLALNIRKIAVEKMEQGLLNEFPLVTSETLDTSSLVAVECSKDDFDLIIRCTGEALIYSQVHPSEIDSILANRRSELMIKGGTLSGQLYAAGIRTFYRNDLYRALYSGQKEILSGMRYNDLLEYYTELLDGNRLCLIASGNLDFDSLVKESEEVFGNLNSSYKETCLFAAPKFPAKNSQKVKLNHTFLTDISRDKAGPRPAVLIPTTDFSDPVQYWFSAPDSFRMEDPFTRTIFNALLLRLDAICRNIIQDDDRYKSMSCRLEENSSLVSFGQITFFNVKFIADADALLQRALDLLETELSDALLVDLIKSSWIKEVYRNAAENLGAARIIAKKIDSLRLADHNDGGKIIPECAFWEDYKRTALASEEDFHAVFNRYLKDGAWKFYSADSKK